MGSKKELKLRRTASQNGTCALSNTALPEDTSLYDTDRVIPKAEGGTYREEDNVRSVEPVAHMERHGTLRIREEQLELLKSTFDDRVQTMKLLLKVSNQLLAYQRRVDHRHPDTEAWLSSQTEPFRERLSLIDGALGAAIRAYDDPVARCAMGVPGLGPITVAALSVYVDLAKAATPSALWRYTGIHCPSHERYEKGVAGGGNKTLRTVLWNTANVMMKMRTSPYRDVYDRTKLRLAESERVVRSRNTQGKVVEVTWRDTKPCHRHGAPRCVP